MENKEISRALKLLSQLMELHQENSFKIKSIANNSVIIKYKAIDSNAIF